MPPQPAASQPPSKASAVMLVRDESDDSMAEVRQAKRFAKREMLARQTSGA